MLSYSNNNQNNQENINPDFINNENINENRTDINNIFVQTNNKDNNNSDDQPVKTINRQALKRIENILLTQNKNDNGNKNFVKTEIKQSKIFSDNIYKTLNKPSTNYSFNPFNYPKEEKYSLLKMKKIKSNKFSPYKSTNHLYNKVENTFDEEKNDSKYLYYKIKKNKKIFSLRKAYISYLSFQNGNNENKEFKLFRDCDIGLNDGNKIKVQYEDFDVDSEDDIIEQGVNRCIQNIGSAIELFRKKNAKYTGEYMKVIKIIEK